ncbi:hypothetical protein ANAPC3_00872 [Anaplasma phagocytophilum]|nr:hypothetical protein ANAPC3_00872 [Anaplasma phagocytophilum]SBO32502.1 hypothetical protein ANAPC4_00833 [Anaplasma phagocytophilum]
MFVSLAAMVPLWSRRFVGPNSSFCELIADQFHSLDIK